MIRIGWEQPKDGTPLPEALAAVRASSLLSWHRSARFHGADGRRTAFQARSLGKRREVPPPGSNPGGRPRTLYPRVNPVAIVVVASSDDSRCLLARKPNRTYFTCVSGFCEHSESAEAAAVREVYEETGVRTGR